MKVVVAGAAFVALMTSLLLPGRKNSGPRAEPGADKAVAVQFSTPAFVPTTMAVTAAEAEIASGR